MAAAFTWGSFGDVKVTVPPSEMLELLQNGVSIKQFPNTPSLKITSESVDREYVRYLNRLSSIVYDTLGDQQLFRIKFFACGKKASHDHPTATKCSPHFVAVKQDSSVPIDSDIVPEKSQAASEFCWSQVEATGEIKSKRRKKDKADLHAASYTGFLLQARPDLVSVLGILVEPEEFSLLLTNACGVYDMEPARWESPGAGDLLCTWIQRLYNPEVDESITRSYQSKLGKSFSSIADFPSKPTFTIQNDGKTFEGCKVIKVGVPFNRRTTIFETKEGKVIKEQYIEVDRRFEEGSILEKIHSGGHFPGVVQRDSYDVVKRTTQANTSDGPGSVPSEDFTTVQVNLLAVWEDDERKKTRLVMPDKATPLMDVETPRDILILAYDLLEVIRHLYTKHGILHRDISMGNVLCRSEYLDMDSTPAQDIPGMCFAAHLLGDKGLGPGAGRLDTKVTLIDYDMSEDCGKQTPNQPTSRAGTLKYMACSVRSGEVYRGLHIFYPMPQLDSSVETRYEECVPGRLEPFPLNTIKYHEKTQRRDIEHFQHKLGHDTESVFWVLLYWFMQAQPTPGSQEEQVEDPLKWHYWDAFTGGDHEWDPRPICFVDCDSPHLFHRSYESLEPLLESMANMLKGDPQVLGDTDPDRTNAEYLVEAFQRLILNFLFNHYDQPFMCIKKASNPRKVAARTSYWTQDTPTDSLASQSGESSPFASQARGSITHKRRFDSVNKDVVEEQERAPKKKKPNESLSPLPSSGPPTNNIP